MSDPGSTDLAVAAYYARTEDPGHDDRPTRRELEAEERAPRGSDLYRGICGGCKQPVSASGPEGSCLWKGGAWHPSCREADKAAATLDLAGAA